MEQSKVLVVIPARGGSKGIPGKNIKLLGNKPLIEYTIEAARKCFLDAEICVSTDDENIKRCVENTGLHVPFLRPSELATDSSSTQDVLLHAIEYYESQGYKPDTIVLLQPTSPFRTEKHIQEALEKYDATLEMLVSTQVSKSNPYYNLMEENEQGFLEKSKKSAFTRRQDCPQVYELNGAIYIISVAALKEKKIAEFTQIKKYIMSAEDSLDLDEPIDWEIVEFILSKKSK